MLKPIGTTLQTVFAELTQRCLDAEFDQAYPENGSFSRRVRNGQEYWYYNGYDPNTGTKTVKYAGPAGDPAVAERIARFRTIKDDFRDRRTMVGALKAGGLPVPGTQVGAVIEALAKAGAFRLRCVLIGTTAFQTYSGMLGVRLPSAVLATADVDIAQFHSVSLLVDDTLPPILDVLRSVDAGFHEVPHPMDCRQSTRFRTVGMEVEFLTPNRSGNRYQGRPAAMPALGGAAAAPLRFLDFLIHQPRHSVLLHKAGVPVRVPAPERYAVHKLILATRRREDGVNVTKRMKDIHQAGALIEAMHPHLHHDLADSWAEAWGRGMKWRACLVRGRSMLPDPVQALLRDAVTRACGDTGDDPSRIGF